MVCQFVRITLVGDNNLVVENYINNLIDNNNLHGDLSCGQGLDERTLIITFYDKSEVKSYFNTIKTWLNNNKSNFDSINVIKYDDCTHDESKPEPCVAEVVFSWP